MNALSGVAIAWTTPHGSTYYRETIVLQFRSIWTTLPLLGASLAHGSIMFGVELVGLFRFELEFRQATALG